MHTENKGLKGLSDEAVLQSRSVHGSNTLIYKKEHPVVEAVKALFREPMVIILLAASILYFVNGNTGDGLFLAAAIVLVAAISLYQDSRSRNALEKLKNFTQANCKVIRNGETIEIPVEELVVGDYLIVEEGTLIAADASILRSNDFSVNESILTGESMPVFKDASKEDPFIYKGTTVVSGLAIAAVTAIGNKTQFGKIGEKLEAIEEEKTPLEIQIHDFVKKMVIAGSIVFLIVWGINYYHTQHILDSLLKALTLAMSILPEEIPVAFTTFMALGAWRLMKMGIVVKQMKTVETLGSATIICTDKTGTLTENRMSLSRLYLFENDTIILPEDAKDDIAKELIRLAMWASEPIPFDPMETALHEAYQQTAPVDERPLYRMIHEYPLSGLPPMMTHLFANEEGHRIIAVKGAPEAIMAVSDLTTTQKNQIELAMNTMAADGYRILAVGESDFKGDQFPSTQQEFKFQFKGLVGFYDPPKKNISEVLSAFYNAGITVKMVTGDTTSTSMAIARQIQMIKAGDSITGAELMTLDVTELQKRVIQTNIFTRMFPDAKLKIINALKANNEIVAMTGDGVNDGPALKAAHIGIAMGKKGSEIAKQAASLILVEDDLSKMVDAVAIGRKIYANLKKAIRYIISIHIPIILTVFLPLALGWVYPNIFTPVHIIFLELIMGPTCSIIYENEPMEKNTMNQPPRPYTVSFFNWQELSTSIIQGIMITVGTLTAYQFAVSNRYNEALTRTMVFMVLIAANITLTLVNRSFLYSVIHTFRYKNRMVPQIIALTLVITALLLFVAPLTRFFEFETPALHQILIGAGIGLGSVIWYEIVKWIKRRKIAG